MGSRFKVERHKAFCAILSVLSDFSRLTMDIENTATVAARSKLEHGRGFAAQVRVARRRTGTQMGKTRPHQPPNNKPKNTPQTKIKKQKTPPPHTHPIPPPPPPPPPRPNTQIRAGPLGSHLDLRHPTRHLSVNTAHWQGTSTLDIARYTSSRLRVLPVDSPARYGRPSDPSLGRFGRLWLSPLVLTCQ